jgi:hypothetical protein
VTATVDQKRSELRGPQEQTPRCPVIAWNPNGDKLKAKIVSGQLLLFLFLGTRPRVMNDGRIRETRDKLEMCLNSQQGSPSYLGFS